MKARAKYIDTVWEVWTYCVWGNQKDGYDVNDRFLHHRVYPLRLRVTVYNPGTPREFEAAYPTDLQIKHALNCNSRIKITTFASIEGDDGIIYADHALTGYPLGELRCTSHESLSPPKASK